ncbi:Aldose reductase [Rhizina undulata]
MANSDSLPTHFTLCNGESIPAIGLGTYHGVTEGVYEAVLEAVKAGYRVPRRFVNVDPRDISDCAAAYPTESEVGRALADCSVPRSELFVTSKVWPNNLRPEYVEKSVRQSLKDLRTDYLDLLLIHWPLTLKPGGHMFTLDEKGYVVFDEDWDLLDTWKAFEGLVERKVVKSIGVSNFNQRHLDHIFSGCKIQPAVNQVELHPWLAQNDLVKYCKEKNILLTAYAPLAFLNNAKWTKNVDDIPKVQQIADRYKQGPSQVLLSWGIQRGYVVIPKSFNAERLRTNLKGAILILESNEETVFPLDNDAREVFNSLDRGEDGRMHDANGWGQKFDENAPIETRRMTP